MKNCTVCNKPLKKEGRTEHYGCRMFKKTFKKIAKNGSMIDSSSNQFKTTLKAISNNPNLLRK